MDVKTAIEKRRSVRKYQEDKEVSDADIIEIVDAGRTAPSWKNLQPWRFIIVRSQELREEAADCLIHPNPAKKSVKTASTISMMSASETSLSSWYFLTLRRFSIAVFTSMELIPPQGRSWLSQSLD